MRELERTASLLRQIPRVCMWHFSDCLRGSLLSSQVSEWTLDKSELSKCELILPEIAFLLPDCLAFLPQPYVY